ncbi:hypothetical protein Tco_0656894 [Tanacetum coccineum]|uniref:Uncharacterized protein n=1 Tax=Tanacetum coccineum TaxID=301880 RepID=A0ABQ4XB64_9ASTR
MVKWHLGPPSELVLGELHPDDVDLVWVLAMLPLPCSASKLEAVVVLEIFWSYGDVSMSVDVCWVPLGLDGPSP